MYKSCPAIRAQNTLEGTGHLSIWNYVLKSNAKSFGYLDEIITLPLQEVEIKERSITWYLNIKRTESEQINSGHTPKEALSNNLLTRAAICNRCHHRDMSRDDSPANRNSYNFFL